MRFFGAWILLAIGLTTSVASLAAPSTSVMSAEDREALIHPWDFSMALAHYESLYNEEDGSRVSANTMTNTLSYKINRNYTVSGELDLVQDMLNSENNDIAGASLALKHSEIKFANRLLLLTPSLSTDIPVSQFDHHVGLQSSLGAGLKIAINPDYMISKKLSFDVKISGKRYFNTYTEGADGTPNAEYGSTQGFDVGWDFNKFFSFVVSASHFDYWNYYGVLQEYYGHSEELDFNINKMWQLAIGHSFGNPLMPFVPVWKADNSTGNYSLVDDQYSTVYAQVTVNF